MKRLIIKSSKHIKASTNYDTSKYHIVEFTPASYARLKKFIADDSRSGDNAFGYIERIDIPYAVDVTVDDIPQWTTYKLISDTYNDALDGGSLDLSLSYAEQVAYLISELEESIKRNS